MLSVAEPAQASRVTVLLPTYNRARALGRAVDSVLSQTWQDLSLLISDNASVDDTQAVGERYSAGNPRVRYHRQPTNLGPIGNFNWLLGQAETEYLLMLADDDWLDSDYIARCVAAMDADPELSIVTGATCYYEGDAPADLILDTQLVDPAPERRVIHYLRNSWSSAAFYGLLRREAVRSALPIPNVMGADWLFVAALAFGGKVITVDDTHLNRARGGTSADFRRIAEVSGLSRRAARNPHLAIAFNQFRDIAFESSAYRRLPRWRRIGLGVTAAAAVVAGHPFDVFWDAVGPLVLHSRVIRVTGPVRDRWRALHPR